MNRRSCGPDDLRAERARFRISVYALGVEMGLTPSQVSAYLNARQPMPPGLAERFREAIDKLAAAGAAR